MDDLERALREAGPSREERQTWLQELDATFFDESSDAVLYALKKLPSDPDFDDGEGRKNDSGCRATETGITSRGRMVDDDGRSRAVEDAIAAYQGVLDAAVENLAEHVLENYEEFVEGGERTLRACEPRFFGDVTQTWFVRYALYDISTPALNRFASFRFPTVPTPGLCWVTPKRVSECSSS